YYMPVFVQMAGGSNVYSDIMKAIEQDPQNPLPPLPKDKGPDITVKILYDDDGHTTLRLYKDDECPPETPVHISYSPTPRPSMTASSILQNRRAQEVSDHGPDAAYLPVPHTSTPADSISQAHSASSETAGQHKEGQNKPDREADAIPATSASRTHQHIGKARDKLKGEADPAGEEVGRGGAPRAHVLPRAISEEAIQPEEAPDT
ncbi:hypothetical protein MPER_05186, partial [Moniliophthora perniciosa FA553]